MPGMTDATNPSSTEATGEVLRLITAMSWRLVDGEVVALDAGKMTYLGVNGSGAELWQALVDGATRAQLIDRLLDRYEVDRDTASNDVDAFIADLRTRELLQ